MSGLPYLRKPSVDDFLIGIKLLFRDYNTNKYHYLLWLQLLRTFTAQASCEYGASTCPKGLVKRFLGVPQAAGLTMQLLFCPSSLWKSLKTLHKTFRTRCIPKLRTSHLSLSTPYPREINRSRTSDNSPFDLLK